MVFNVYCFMANSELLTSPTGYDSYTCAAQFHAYCALAESEGVLQFLLCGAEEERLCERPLRAGWEQEGAVQARLP